MATGQTGKSPESAKSYLQRHHVMAYLEDAMLQLLAKKDEDGKTQPFHFLTDYFKRAVNGKHVVLREYAFIIATPYNQRCFIKLFWDTYKNISDTGRVMICTEYHSLLRLLCRDFPLDMVNMISLVIFSDVSSDNVVSFSDFVYAFQICFYFKDFLEKCSDEFCYISSSSSSSLRAQSSPIIVPTSETLIKETSSYHNLDDDSDKSDQLHESIDPKLFWLSTQHLFENQDLNLTLPNVTVVESAIFSQDTLSYYNFVNALVRSDTISDEIGVLPPRNMQYKP